MKQENRNHILVRYGLITGFILLLAMAISYKLFRTTIVEREEWNKLANQTLEKIDTILPERGDILSDKGYILATNLRYYTVRIDFRADNFKRHLYVGAIDSLADSMAHHFPRYTRAEWRTRLEKPLKTPAAEAPRSYPLITNISYIDLQKIKKFPFFKIGNANKTGLSSESVLRRSNPYGSMARRSVGGVGQTATCKEVHGIYGLEKALDSLLYGKCGFAKKVTLTKDVVNWTTVDPTPGYSVRTTIDIQLQDIVENELNRVLDSCAADWGCAVLMEVATGDIKAISNLERSKKGNGYIEALNYAVVGFEPGSVVKPISMMIALEDGLVSNLEEVIPIGKSWAYAGGRPITDSHYNGALRVREVIEQSSNIGMARIITRGYDRNPKGFVERLRGLGFLDPIHTGIAGETTPSFPPDPFTKEYTRVGLSRMCYGYASKIPPIYTLSMYNAMANGGRYVRPRLVKGLHTENFDSVLPVTYIRDRVCSEENARKMRYMLKQVVYGEHGTGRSLKNDKVALAGKTGTCYTIPPGARSYDTSRKRLAFCGFFPADAPKYSCMVLTYWPKRNMVGAASTSGQVMKNIALKMYSRGLLGNTSEFANDEIDRSSPQLYATLKPNRHERVRTSTGMGSERHPSAPRPSAPGTVPSVIGLGLREAVVQLENSGFNVRFHGTGFVRGQLPAQGTPLKKGQIVTLALSQ